MLWIAAFFGLASAAQISEISEPISEQTDTSCLVRFFHLENGDTYFIGDLAVNSMSAAHEYCTLRRADVASIQNTDQVQEISTILDTIKPGWSHYVTNAIEVFSSNGSPYWASLVSDQISKSMYSSIPLLPDGNREENPREPRIAIIQKDQLDLQALDIQQFASPVLCRV